MHGNADVRTAGGDAMTFRRRLRLWRRRWCLRRGHPMADWSPVVVSYKEPDRFVSDIDSVGPVADVLATAAEIADAYRGRGTIIPGAEFTQRAWRCARHDKQPTR